MKCCKYVCSLGGECAVATLYCPHDHLRVNKEPPAGHIGKRRHEPREQHTTRSLQAQKILPKIYYL
jgi:hypothetical protein